MSDKNMYLVFFSRILSRDVSAIVGMYLNELDIEVLNMALMNSPPTYNTYVHAYISGTENFLKTLNIYNIKRGLTLTVEYGNTEDFQYFLNLGIMTGEIGIDHDDEDSTYLLWQCYMTAVGKGNLEIMKIINSILPDPKYYDYPHAAKKAGTYGHIHIISYFIDHNYINGLPDLYAVAYDSIPSKNIEIQKLLSSQMGSITVEQLGELMRKATKFGSLEIIKFLELSFQPDQRPLTDPEYFTAACLYNTTDVVGYLLEKNSNYREHVPWETIMMHSSLDSLKFLYEQHGLNPFRCYPNIMTSACRLATFEVIEYLYEIGVTNKYRGHAFTQEHLSSVIDRLDSFGSILKISRLILSTGVKPTQYHIMRAEQKNHAEVFNLFLRKLR